MIELEKYREALECAKVCGDNDCIDCKYCDICVNDKNGWYGTLLELVKLHQEESKKKINEDEIIFINSKIFEINYKIYKLRTDVYNVFNCGELLSAHNKKEIKKLSKEQKDLEETYVKYILWIKE